VHARQQHAAADLGKQAMDAAARSDAIQILTEQKIYILLCDNLPPPHGG